MDISSINRRILDGAATVAGCILMTCCIPAAQYGPVSADPSLPNLAHSGLWIVNEGAFTFGQGSLSFYDYTEDSLHNRVFQAVNGRPLGDVFQSISYHRGKAYLVVNNSQKVEVLDSAGMQHLHTITGLVSPRHVTGYGDRLFISDLYSDRLLVLDADDHRQLAAIPTGGWTEEMAVVGNSLYVTVRQTYINNLPGSRKGLLRISLDNLEEQAFLPLVQGAGSLSTDRDGYLWVLCDGGLGEETGGLFRIDPLTMAIVSTVMFDGPDYSASRLQAGPDGNTLYFLLSDPEEGINSHDLHCLGIGDTALSAEPLLEGGGLYLYGYHLDHQRNRLFVTDAVGLLQEGFLYEYTLDGAEYVSRHQAGIFPGQVLPR